MNKFEQISIWLNEYEAIGDWLYFNAVIMNDISSSLQTVPGNTVLTEYIDGSSEHELVFAIAMIKLYDLEQSETNLTAIKEIENFANWISENQTLPDFGENVTVNFVKVLDEIPDLAVDSESNKCKYQFQCKVNYLE